MFDNVRYGRYADVDKGKRKTGPKRALKRKARNETAFAARCLDWFGQCGKAYISAEEMALSCKGSKGQALRVIDGLVKEGRLAKTTNRPAHDSNREWLSGGTASGWRATLYRVTGR